jgi:hypothetical protein
VRTAILVLLGAGLAGPPAASPAIAADMDGMAAHMTLTPEQPRRSGDVERAAAIADAVRAAIEPYRDYHKAIAAGFKPGHLEVPQKEYHFSSRANFIAALRGFDVKRPTSLLYERTADGGFRLIGAMYTDRRDASDAELDQRVPLSMARWHEHIDLCLPPEGAGLKGMGGPHPAFGPRGSISTAAACSAAGGRFIAHLYGWMVHVYPYERDLADVYALPRNMADDMAGGPAASDAGGGAMGGMKMP